MMEVNWDVLGKTPPLSEADIDALCAREQLRCFRDEMGWSQELSSTARMPTLGSARVHLGKSR